MDEQMVREHADAHCQALLSGDIELAAEEFSKILRANVNWAVIRGGQPQKPPKSPPSKSPPASP